jgi:hypothetical protein
VVGNNFNYFDSNDINNAYADLDNDLADLAEQDDEIDLT